MNSAVLIIPQELVHALGWTLLHSLWQGLVIMGIASLLMVILRQSRATARYVVLCAAMSLIVLSSVITFSLLYSVPSAAAATEMTQPFAQLAVLSTEQAAGDTGPMIRLMETYGRNVSGFMEQNSHLMVLAWFLGFMFFIARYAGGLFYIGKLRKNSSAPGERGWQERATQLARQIGLRKAVRVLESSLIRVPVTVGYLKPVILIPMGMVSRIPPDQVEAILMHELAHIIRRDYLINLLQSLVEALFFYHPAIWWLSGRMRLERENICDDIALSQSKDPLTYIKALTTMEELTSRTPVMASAISGGKKQLLNRVRRMVQPENRRIKSSEGLVILLTLFIFLFLFGAGANLNVLKAGSSLPSATAAIHPDAINSLTDYRPAELTLASDPGIESSHAVPQSMTPPDGYGTMNPDTTIGNAKAEEEARKQAEKARQEALEMLEQAEAQREEAMREYHEALQQYHETMKELREEAFEAQFKWGYVDSLDSIIVVRPHRGSKEMFLYGGNEFFGDRKPEMNYRIEGPGKQKYHYSYSWPHKENFLEDEDVDIIIRELNDDILLDIRKDIDIENELKLREVEKEIQKHQKDIERGMDMAYRWHMESGKPSAPRFFLEKERGPEQIIRQELREDGLIRHGNEYIVEIDSSSMYINGEKQSRNIYKKYRKIYEGVSGNTLDIPVRLIF